MFAYLLKKYGYFHAQLFSINKIQFNSIQLSSNINSYQVNSIQFKANQFYTIISNTIQFDSMQFNSIQFNFLMAVLCCFGLGGIIGPCFFRNDERDTYAVNGPRYRAMLADIMWSELDNIVISIMWFQLIGVTCHTSNAILTVVRRTFGYWNSFIICSVFLVNTNNTATLDEFDAKIPDTIAGITMEIQH